MALARKIALITGAHGGMGKACARMLGVDHDLVLTDIDAAKLDAFAQELAMEGHVVQATVAGDIADSDVAVAAVSRARAAGRLTAIVHTAGLSPALASWDKILRANLVGTEQILRAIEADLSDAPACVMIASMAGHRAPPSAEIDDILSDPLRADLLQQSELLMRAFDVDSSIYGMGMIAYAHSKRSMIRMTERRGPDWARHGARIVTLSPGLMLTPMGRKEADVNPSAKATGDATPIGRWGTVIDIASAAAFLLSDRASFITGTDLRIDGGTTPAMAGVTF